MNEVMFGNYLWLCASVLKQAMYDYCSLRISDEEAEEQLKYLDRGLIGAYLDYKEIDPEVMKEAFRKQRELKKKRREKRGRKKAVAGRVGDEQKHNSTQVERDETLLDVQGLHHLIRGQTVD